jgi:predicted DNA-binding transcriptional regulator AlpA
MNNNLYDILQDNPVLNVTINAGQLIDCIDYCVLKTRKELERQITDANTETYLTRQKVTEMLSVDLSTLYHWAQNGTLVPIKIGGKVRYRMSDINKKLTVVK